MDALGLARTAVVGISGGGPFAAACAAVLPDRVGALALVSALGMTGWGSGGMASGERLALGLATRAPPFGGWFLERLAVLARRSPRLFFEIATVELPAVDRDALERRVQREAFIEGYVEAFRRGRAGVTQDLRILTRPWGFCLDSIPVPTHVHHGAADTTVPPDHARRFARSIPDARLRIHPGHGHFSLLPDAAEEILADLVAA
jgi:pimeloyl-ACP methyl ester carboxylesterase